MLQCKLVLSYQDGSNGHAGWEKSIAFKISVAKVYTPGRGLATSQNLNENGMSSRAWVTVLILSRPFQGLHTWDLFACCSYGKYLSLQRCLWYHLIWTCQGSQQHSKLSSACRHKTSPPISKVAAVRMALVGQRNFQHHRRTAFIQTMSQ